MSNVISIVPKLEANKVSALEKRFYYMDKVELLECFVNRDLYTDETKKALFNVLRGACVSLELKDLCTSLLKELDNA